MARSKTTDFQITQSKLLAVEGDDEFWLCKAMLRHLGVSDADVYDVEGGARFKQQIIALVQDPNFFKVQLFAVIRDAENNADASFQSTVDLLSSKDISLNFPTQMNIFSENVPATYKPRVGVFITPQNLDALFLQTIVGTPELNCVDTFLNCLPTRSINESKAKIQAYLVSRPKLVHRVGLAARNGDVNLDHNAFAELKNFLLEFQS